MSNTRDTRPAVFDHGFIYVFNPAYYTPVGLFWLDRWYCVAMLIWVWLGTAAAFVAKMRGLRASRRTWTVLYMLLGGLPLVTIWLLLGAFGLWPVLLVTGGNALFLLGAYIFSEEMPVQWPRSLRFDKLFGLVGVAAIAMHATALVSAITSIG